MNTALYIISSVVWGLLGLGAGYVLGRLSRAAARIEEAAIVVEPEPEPAVAEPVAVIEEADPHTPWYRQPERVLGAAVVVLALLSVVYMAVRLDRQQAEIDAAQAANACQALYNSQTIIANSAAREAGLIERNANRTILEKAFSGRLGPSSLPEWNAEVQRADDLRAANPYPARPNCDQEANGDG